MQRLFRIGLVLKPSSDNELTNRMIDLFGIGLKKKKSSKKPLKFLTEVFQEAYLSLQEKMMNGDYDLDYDPAINQERVDAAFSKIIGLEAAEELEKPTDFRKMQTRYLTKRGLHNLEDPTCMINGKFFDLSEDGAQRKFHFALLEEQTIYEEALADEESGITENFNANKFIYDY